MLLAHGLPGSGHFGSHKTHARIVPYFTWPGMRRDVAEHCRSCHRCHKAAPNSQAKAPLRPFPFGVKNGPAIFQRLSDIVLADWHAFAKVYIDDFILFSNSWTEHGEHLKVVLGKLREAGLTANRK